MIFSIFSKILISRRQKDEALVEDDEPHKAMHIPLPSILSTALAASTPWPVKATCPPLHYQPLVQMKELRKGEIFQGIIDEDSLV